jgi:hypothetical protein
MCVNLIPGHTYYEYLVWVLKSSMTCIGQGGKGRRSPEQLDDSEVAASVAAVAALDGGR